MQAEPTQLETKPPASTGSPDDRIANRVPIECQVAMRFENFDDFITECSMNISTTGMFVKCSDPQPAGSVLDFQFALADGEKLIRGYGEVVWSRRRDDGPERPAGMGIRYLNLDAGSRELIQWTVTRRYITGAGTCDVEAIKSAMHRAAEREARSLATRPSAEPPEPKGQDAPRYLEAGYAAVATEPRAHLKHLAPALAVLALGGFYLFQSGSPAVDAAPAEADVAPIEETVSLNTTPESADAAGGSRSPYPKSAPVQPTEPTAAVQTTAITEATARAIPSPSEVLKDWAQAWSRQEVKNYLACYAADFRPTGGLSRTTWEAQRQARISRPRWIQIELGNIATQLEGDARARVTFDQSYTSDTYQDVVRKTLIMVREREGWRILEELAEG